MTHQYVGSDLDAPILGTELETAASSVHEYYPGPEELRVLGEVALALYAVVASLAIRGLVRFRADKSVRDIGFFALMFLSAAMCMPWAIGYIRYKEKPEFWTFVLKSLARIAFFAAFCIVTNRWAKVLYLKHGTKIFHHYILIGLNVVLVAIAMIDITLNRERWSEQTIQCESIRFPITVLVQALFTLGVIVVWTALGAQVLARIRAWKNVAHVLIDSNLFGDAMNNLALIMFVTGGCLLLQFTMLVLRFVADTTNAKYSSDVFTRCGVLWTSLSDFIPHVVPSVVFMLYMQKKHSTVATLQQRYDMNAMLSEQESYVSDLLLSSASGGDSHTGSRPSAGSITGYQDLLLEDGEEHLVMAPRRGTKERPRSSRGMFNAILSQRLFGRAGAGLANSSPQMNQGVDSGGADPRYRYSNHDEEDAYDEEGRATWSEGAEDDDELPGLRETLS